ncbi:hypothetical protein ABGV42_01390 [Paenibacillus pabuli]
MSFIAINQSNFPIVALVHELADDKVKVQIGSAWSETNSYAGKQNMIELNVEYDPDGEPYFTDEENYFYMSDTHRTDWGNK